MASLPLCDDCDQPLIIDRDAGTVECRTCRWHVSNLAPADDPGTTYNRASIGFLLRQSDLTPETVQTFKAMRAAALIAPHFQDTVDSLPD